MKTDEGFSPSPKKFTLVELLVVIAIVTTLSSLLLPALSNALAIAYRTTCANNLRQIGLGVLMYNDDNNGWLPTFRHDANGSIYYWPFLLKDYLGVDGNFGASGDTNKARGTIYVCPADEVLNVPDGSDQWAPSSYGTNRINFQDADPDRPKFKLSSVQYPSESSYFIDNNSLGYQGDYSLAGYWGKYYNLSHNFGMNILYVDGHIGYKQWPEFPSTTQDVLWEWTKP